MLTIGNLFCGCLAINFIFLGKTEWVLAMTGLSLLLDFLDGFVARLLNQPSSIGKDLDSLADVVSFGVVPGFMVFFMAGGTSYHPVLTASIGFLIPCFAALRLAKFNNDERSSDYFYGLATPAMTLLVAGFYATLCFNYMGLYGVLSNVIFCVSLVLVVCFLMISDIKLISNKIIAKPLAESWPLWITVILSIAAILIFKFLGLALAIVIYFVLSIIANYIVK